MWHRGFPTNYCNGLPFWALQRPPIIKGEHSSLFQLAHGRME